MRAPGTPFREDDLAMRVESLRRTRAELAEELRRTRVEIAKHRPWSWGRFLVGFLMLPAAAAILVLQYLR
jgi:hypothetical protein